MTPPVPGSFSTRQWRWILLVTRRHDVRFLYWPPHHPAGLRRIKMYDRNGYDVGQLVWMVCDECGVGSINKISIVDWFQRQGLGRRLVQRAVADGPDYRWRTTGQSPMAKKFFPVIELETGMTIPEHASICEHLHGRHPMPRPASYPRPVLDPGV